MEMGLFWSSWMTPSLGPAPPGCAAGRSTSIWRSSRTPLRSISRKDDCVAWAALRPVNVSRMRDSTRRFASSRNSSAFFFRVSVIDASTRSRMIWSTSRPWNPTSVNFVASTLMKGACASLLSRRAISVFPQPVGPIIRMFFGTISFFRSSPSSCRRHRFRRAIATAPEYENIGGVTSASPGGGGTFDFFGTDARAARETGGGGAVPTRPAHASPRSARRCGCPARRRWPAASWTRSPR